MAGQAPPIDLTARTFETLRERGLDLLRRRVGTFRYGSFIATDVAPALIDVMAWMQEQNAYYYNRRQINDLLDIADTREAMVYLTRGFGYRMRPATSASVAVRAVPTPPQPVSITLEKGARISVNDLAFEVAADYVIPAGATSWPDATTDDVIVLVEGTTRAETFVSDGSEFQKFEFGQAGTIDGSVTVSILGEEWGEVSSLVFIEGNQRGRDTFVGTGLDAQEYTFTLLYALIDAEDEDHVVVIVNESGSAAVWQQVDTFSGAPREFTLAQQVDGTTTVKFGTAINGAAPGINATIDVLYLIAGTQKRYQLMYDPEDRASILFGDGVFGVIPPNGATINVTYRTGGGVRGNVAAGVINTVMQGVLPTGARTPVFITNIERGSGGEPQETLEHARFFAPRRVKANERAVTKEDWTAIAATYSDPIYGSPSHASAYLKQRNPELNTVQVAVWSRDNMGRLALAGTPLKLGIKNALIAKKTITTAVEMVDGRIVLMDAIVDVVLQQGKNRQDVFPAVIAAIEEFFNSAHVLPGIDLSVSKLYAAIQEVSGVDRAEIVKITGTQAVFADVTPPLGDGSTNSFSGQFILDDGVTLLPTSVTISDGTQQVVDDGEGGFAGTGVSGTVDYTTGVFTVSFAATPVDGAVLVAEARSAVFFDTIENLGTSNGIVTNLDGATVYYPIVARGPRGVWSGDPHKVIDSFAAGGTRVRGRLPSGIIPGTLFINDNGGQGVQDNGVGVIVTNPGGVPVGSVVYASGDLSFDFPVAPTKPIRARWHTRRVEILAPADLPRPLVPGRVFFWGGYGADGAETPAEIFAVDDSAGAIFGNTLVGGTIRYDDGRIIFDWNTDPAPGPAGGNAYVATLAEARDGVRKTFTFTIGGGVDISRFAASNLDRGEGRTRFQLSDLSINGFTIEDAFDNWQGGINGASLQRTGVNSIDYAAGTGTISFGVAPPVGTPATFAVQITNVATFMYAGWSFYVKTPGGPGLDKGLFADNRGRLWGPPAAGSSNAFPIDRLEFLRGRYMAALAGTPIAAGRTMILSYDALTGVPPALDIVIQGNEIAAAGRIIVNEKPPEIFV